MPDQHRGFATLLAIVVLIGIALAYDDAEDGLDSQAASAETPAARGSITVDRVWSEYDTGNAIVRYTNDTGRTFSRLVTIQCVAVDRDSRYLGVNERSFFAYERGPIEPGFSGVVRVPVSLNGASLATMECEITEAR
jgi:hypothetical protein